eukprot:GEMP01024845.1.p1 GENE.GEMP01024845.1~~GEMP01024845.1.p1  ORF type:complete len:479 (+),score=93.86 GEMP01024845.1:120-1556(+)
MVDPTVESWIAQFGEKLRKKEEAEEEHLCRYQNLEQEIALEKAKVDQLKLSCARNPCIQVDTSVFTFKSALLEERKKALESIQEEIVKKKAYHKELESSLAKKRREANSLVARQAGEWTPTVAERLGLRIERRDDEQALDFTFWNIDPEDCKREYFFCLGLQENNASRYAVLECEPHVPELRRLVSNLNHSSSLPQFIAAMRHAFISTIYKSSPHQYSVKPSRNSYASPAYTKTRSRNSRHHIDPTTEFRNTHTSSCSTRARSTHAHFRHPSATCSNAHVRSFSHGYRHRYHTEDQDDDDYDSGSQIMNRTLDANDEGEEEVEIECSVRHHGDLPTFRSSRDKDGSLVHFDSVLTSPTRRCRSAKQSLTSSHGSLHRYNVGRNKESLTSFEDGGSVSRQCTEYQASPHRIKVSLSPQCAARRSRDAMNNSEEHMDEIAEDDGEFVIMTSPRNMFRNMHGKESDNMFLFTPTRKGVAHF